MVALQVLGRRDQGDPPLHFQRRGIEASDGYLGSHSVQQFPDRLQRADSMFLRQQPSKLAFLRAMHFGPIGREKRIERSLAAVDSPISISLDPESWRWIAEDLDIEDIGSRNGIYAGDKENYKEEEKRVYRHELTDGDYLLVGETTLVFKEV